MDKSAIRTKYIETILETGHKPASVYAFAKSLGMSESDFYSFYASFEAIEKDAWKSIFDETLERLAADEIYQTYSPKDKLLTFYYVWVAKLRENRSYILSLKDSKLKAVPLGHPSLGTFKAAFLKYADTLVKEGVEIQEVKDRKYLTDKYQHGFWLQTLFVLNYWLNDDSPNFEMTDAAIEKAVNLSFKLLGESTLDNIVDFGKFLFQKAQ